LSYFELLETKTDMESLKMEQKKLKLLVKKLYTFKTDTNEGKVKMK